MVRTQAPDPTKLPAGQDTAGDSGLTELREIIQEAVAFSSEWPQEIRAAVFDLVAQQLIINRGKQPSPAGNRRESQPHSGPGTIGFGEPMERLSRELSVDVDQLARCVSVSEETGIEIMAPLDGGSTKELQLNYAAVFAFIKEKALRVLDVDAGELRTLCMRHGCYDMANFAANLRWKGFMREIVVKGSKDRRYRASREALVQGERLLHEMVDR
jgi:hypothetical protein